MPLKIHCPNCFKTLLAEDDVAGQRKLCPACGRPFDVPLPLSEDLYLTNVAGECPRCGAEVAPGTTVCQKCHTDITTGKRLPLGQRLRRYTLKTWTIVGLVVIGAGLLGYVGIHTYLTRFRQPSPTASPIQSAPTTPFAAEEWATRLMRAENREERQAARDALIFSKAQAGLAITQAVAAALQTSLESDHQDQQTTWNRRTAIDVLAVTAAADMDALYELGSLLQECESDTALRETAWRARAMLGDTTVAMDLRETWIYGTRRLIFLKRLAKLTGREGEPALDKMVRRAGERIDRVNNGFRRLQTDDETAVLDNLLEVYWDSWNWLGQRRGTALATELFELTKLGIGKPDESLGFEAQKHAIRGARDLLRRVGQRATPLARAAAGMVLTNCVPQYRSAREQIVTSLITVLPDCEPLVQQRLTWAIARLTGRQFGRITGDSQPTESGRSDVEAVLRWARNDGLIDATRLSTPADAYTPPTVLTSRVVPPVRQLEDELLHEFERGWANSVVALKRWLEADIGWTTRLHRLIDPAQHQPNYPALAAVLVIAAEYHEQSLRQELALWREASDQPLWIRQLAYAVLGALDAQSSRQDSGWPAEFELPPAEVLSSGQPGWEHFGYILSAGGQPMIQRLQRFQPATLSAEELAELMEATERAARRRNRNDG